MYRYFMNGTIFIDNNNERGLVFVGWNGKVEIVDIKFGNNVYENVNVKHLTPTDESSHMHASVDKKRMKKKRVKKVKEIVINGTKYRAIK